MIYFQIQRRKRHLLILGRILVTAVAILKNHSSTQFIRYFVFDSLISVELLLRKLRGNDDINNSKRSKELNDFASKGRNNYQKGSIFHRFINIIYRIEATDVLIPILFGIN